MKGMHFYQLLGTWVFLWNFIWRKMKNDVKVFFFWFCFKVPKRPSLLTIYDKCFHILTVVSRRQFFPGSLVRTPHSSTFQPKNFENCMPSGLRLYSSPLEARNFGSITNYPTTIILDVLERVMMLIEWNSKILTKIEQTGRISRLTWLMNQIYSHAVATWVSKFLSFRLIFWVLFCDSTFR